MSNSIIFFNCYLNLRGLSKFTLLNNFRSMKSSCFNSIFLFNSFKFLYLSIFFSQLVTVLGKKYNLYLNFFLFSLFFTQADVILLNNKSANFTYSWLLFFTKINIFFSIFFQENFKYINNCSIIFSSLKLLNVFNSYFVPVKYINLNQQMYSYLVTLLKLKNFYNFFMISVNLSYIYLHVAKDFIYPLANFFKKNLVLGLKGLYDIFVIDYPSRLRRFELVYCFLSVYTGVRVFLKTHISENTTMYSISNVFNSSNWLERECWDLFGVFFANHKNLRRILTDYGFRGFPFRKDFPLTGYIEVRFDDSLFSIVYEPLEISQEFRVFNFKSPWESYEL